MSVNLTTIGMENTNLCICCNKDYTGYYFNFRENLCVTCCKTKRCTKCRIIKEKNQFSKGKAYRGGYRTKCRECERKIKNTRRKENINFRMSEVLRNRVYKAMLS